MIKIKLIDSVVMPAKPTDDYAKKKLPGDVVEVESTKVLDGLKVRYEILNEKPKEIIKEKAKEVQKETSKTKERTDERGF